MNIEFSFSSDAAVIRISKANVGFLKKIFSAASAKSIAELSKSDQSVALALADLRYCADSTDV